MRQNWGKSVWTDRKGSLPSFVFLFWFFVWLLVSFCVCVCFLLCVCVCVLCFCVVVFTVALGHCTAREKLRSESGSACLHTIKQNHATSFSFLFFFFSEWMELLHWNLRQVRSRIRVLLSVFHSGELQIQKLRSHLLRTQSSKVLLLKPGVGQNRAMRVSSTARDFFLELISTLPVHSPALFPKSLPSFSCISWLPQVPVWALTHLPKWRGSKQRLMSALQLLTGYLPFYLDGTLCLNSDMCQFIHCKRKLQLIAAALPAARADCSSSIFGIRIPRKYLFCYKIPKKKD